mgnify:CR=1 FL=1
MLVTVLRAKVHRLRVTATALNYEGPLCVDEAILKHAGMLVHERVLVSNLSTGTRFDTYLIPTPAGSGQVCVNGAAARLAHPGDLLIVMTFAEMSPEEAEQFRPSIVQVDEQNRPLAAEQRKP